MKNLFVLMLMALMAFSCGDKEPQKLNVGRWRAVLQLEKEELPFNFEVAEKDGKQVIYLVNGKEWLPIDEVSYSGDSVKIPMHIFDAEIVALLKDNKLQGEWIKYTTPTPARVPFSAEHNKEYRFSASPQPAEMDVSGKWSVRFTSGTDTTEAVGVFEQQGNHLTGTFLTTTGDYRFLEGNMDGKQLNLSCFDGTHAYLFKAQADDKGNLDGDFWSGRAGHENWTAYKNEQASLPNPDSLTFLKPGYDKLTFSFPDLEGQKVSLDDPKYKGKVVVVQLLGSWCPNCMDETAFLAPYYKTHKNRGVEIIGLAYETSPKFEEAKKRVEKLVQRFDIKYDVLIAGVADKQVATESLPMINRVMAFPTTIFIDKQGRVRKIHTGFAGPGTGAYYEKFVENFNSFIDKLAAE